jgi:hypothetical protein
MLAPKSTQVHKRIHTRMTPSSNRRFKQARRALSSAKQ